MQSNRFALPTAFSPNGQLLVFSEITPEGGEIRIVPVEYGTTQMRAGQPQLYVKTSTVDVRPDISRDGRWLAYMDAVPGTMKYT